MITIRDEREVDRDGIHALLCLAFTTSAEADLVHHLRSAQVVCSSVLAVSEELIVGHALVTHAQIDFETGSRTVGALGPVAVSPDWRRRGIGGSLIRAALERSQALGFSAVIVLGRPAYYGRFGFQRADTWKIRCEFDAPPGAFQIAWFAAPMVGPALAKYHPAFDAV